MAIDYAVKQRKWWYEQAISQTDVERELDRLLGNQDRDTLPEASLSKSTKDAIETVVRRSVSDKLDEWFDGLAAWGGENARIAKRQRQQYRKAGLILKANGKPVA